MPSREMVIVENVNCPGRASHVDAVKYNAMKKALLKVLPGKPPGLLSGKCLTRFRRIFPKNYGPMDRNHIGGPRRFSWTLRPGMFSSELRTSR